MPSTFKRLEIDGLILVEPRSFHDERGFFLESFKESEFAAAGITERFVQDNHSLSVKKVIAVFTTKGTAGAGSGARDKSRVWDVAVDIRPGSAVMGNGWGGALGGKPPHALHPARLRPWLRVAVERGSPLYKCSGNTIRRWMPVYDGTIPTGISVAVGTPCCRRGQNPAAA